MSMDKVIKINSKQGTFDAGASATKTLCDFTLSRGEVYNLKDSFININLQIESTDTHETADATPPVNYSGGRGVQNLDLGILDSYINSSAVNLANVCLVKNAVMRSQNLGNIDNIRRLDHLKNILYNQEKDINDEIDRSYYSLSGVKGVEGWRTSPFQRQEKQGTNLSVNKSHDVMIRMGEIFDICNETQVDCNRLGDVDIHLELNLDKLRILQQLGATLTSPTPVDTDRDYVWLETPAGGTGANGAFEVSSASTITNEPVSALITTNKYTPNDFKTKSPFWVGQKLTFSGAVGTAGSGTAWTTAKERIVVEIDYSLTSGQITLTLDQPLVLIPTIGHVVEDITCVGTNVSTANVIVNKIEMVVKVVSNPTNVPNQLTYYTYKTEEDNLSNRSNVSKNYQVQGDCSNVYIGFGSDVVNAIGTGNKLGNYRLQLNNNDIVNRNVPAEGSIHKDLINKTYLNNQRTLKNLTEYNLLSSARNDVNTYTSKSIMSPLTTRGDLEQSILGVELNATTGGINDIKIYQEIVKVI